MAERIGVFETNSSSTHCVSLGSADCLTDTIPIDKHGTIVLTCEWDDRVNTALNKANYLLHSLLPSGVPFVSWEGLSEEEKESYIKTEDEACYMLFEVLKEVTGATNIIIDNTKNIQHWDSEGDGQVMHITEDPARIKRFIFNPTSTFCYHDRDYGPCTICDCGNRW